MNRYLSELPQLFWVLCQFQQLGVKGHRGSVFSGDRETDGCHVLFPQIQNGEQKAYVLKNKQLTGPTKGVIYLEIDVIFTGQKKRNCKDYRDEILRVNSISKNNAKGNHEACFKSSACHL